MVLLQSEFCGKLGGTGSSSDEERHIDESY
jgi:hypothetical protein